VGRSDYRDTVTDFEMPSGMFFNIAVVHLLSTPTIDRLRALYPDGRFEIRRFRPDIVSTDGEDAGLWESEWIGRTVAIGGNVRLAIIEPCPRRVMSRCRKATCQGFRDPPDDCVSQCRERRRVCLGAQRQGHPPRRPGRAHLS
jgi:uncharacterized protein YcbX